MDLRCLDRESGENAHTACGAASPRQVVDSPGPAGHGLEPIDAVGAPFDPKLHEAIGYEESAEHPEDTVTSELRRGYRLRDRVIRPALVVAEQCDLRTLPVRQKVAKLVSER